jgi:hypothetical protein
MSSRKLADLVRDGELDRARAAIDAGAQLDALDAGRTPLMIACREGHEDIARLLIERGARLDVVGRTGETALGLAMVYCRRVAELLVERGVLGRPLRAPRAGTLLPMSECDVCTRYAEVIEPGDRWMTTPVRLAWLDVLDERTWSEGKADNVERSLRCPFCGTCYEQSFSCEIETAGVTLPDVFHTIRRCESIPAALLGALFIAEDGRLVCRIDRGDDRATFVATMWAGIGGRLLLRRDPAAWLPPTAPRSEVASERMGMLQIELGHVGWGDTYKIYVARPNPDRATFGDKEWVGGLPRTPLADLRLFPEHGGNPYTADDWDWQDGWWYPYSTFRPATPTEEAAHRR